MNRMTHNQNLVCILGLDCCRELSVGIIVEYEEQDHSTQMSIFSFILVLCFRVATGLLTWTL